VATGVLGAYTTWPTFMVDADNLFRNGHAAVGVGYLAASLAGRAGRRLPGHLAGQDPLVAAVASQRRWRLTMTLARRAERLSIYLLQTSHHGRSADYVEVVARARQTGMAGVTVLQGSEGFGVPPCTAATAWPWPNRCPSKW
jgi:hypothetical protein